MAYFINRFKGILRRRRTKHIIRRLFKEFFIEIDRVYNVNNVQVLIIDTLQLEKSDWLLILNNMLSKSFVSKIENLENIDTMRDLAQIVSQCLSERYKKNIVPLNINRIEQAIVRDSKSRLCYNLCALYSRDIRRLLEID